MEPALVAWKLRSIEPVLRRGWVWSRGMVEQSMQLADYIDVHVSMQYCKIIIIIDYLEI